jgi:hypothetical protein
LWEIFLKFEDFRKRFPYYKDPQWLLEKVSTNLYIFSDELTGITKLSEKEKQRTATFFEKPYLYLEDGPFAGFQDPRERLKLSDRISK